jgi:predicted ATPase
VHEVPAQAGPVEPDEPYDSLPADLTTFIGRKDELSRLRELMLGEPPARHVTLLGYGGYGKTRLAVEFAEEVRSHFADGACFVPLAGLVTGKDASEESVSEALAGAAIRALDLEQQPQWTAEQQLAGSLRAKHLLMVFDNCEHVLAGVSLFRDLLRDCKQLSILATSREAPAQRSGQYVDLDPLPVGTGSESLELFIASASAINGDLNWDAEHQRKAEQICERVAGIPLAIELVAAWVDDKSLDQILATLPELLLPEPASDGKRARHSSMDACNEWSWNLLGEREQALLPQLSVFRGGFFPHAVEFVAELSTEIAHRLLRSLHRRRWLKTTKVQLRSRNTHGTTSIIRCCDNMPS